MVTRFFQFLLYLLLVILTYFIVRKISTKVHEAFNSHGLPESVDILGKLNKNTLKLYFLLPSKDKLHSATDVVVTVQETGEPNRVSFYKINNLTKEDGVYTLEINDLDYGKTYDVFIQLKNEWGIGTENKHKSNVLSVSPEEPTATPPPPLPENKEKPYVSCHPNGSYTIYKNWVISPKLESNLSNNNYKIYDKLKEVMKPKSETYTMKLNLV